MALQLEEPYLNTLKQIVVKHVDTKRWRPVIFGSRATGRAYKFSDVDLGFIGSEPLPKGAWGNLWEAFDESDIPYVVDIVDWSETQPEFREVAEQSMVELEL